MTKLPRESGKREKEREREGESECSEVSSVAEYSV